MPPKKKEAAGGKKADQKKKERIIEDKTFGLKNKKGAKQQKFIQQVNNQVRQGNNPKKNRDESSQLTKKEERKKELEAFNQLFRPVATQKVEKGVDPKSVLCAFFKSGQCTKGDKCKFSHDMTVERKSEKKSLYFDDRKEDNMEDWDEDKLKEVVEKKHGEREKKLPPTDIICKHFIEAIELNKYGWFWECPNNGDKCHYRHCLPPGFVLKKDKKKEKKEDITIEELVEIERSKLGYNLTKITYQSFIAWKKKKIEEKKAKDRTESDRKKAEFRAGKNIGLSGREMFTFNPELANDTEMDEGEATMEFVKEQEENEDTANFKEIDIDNLINEACDVDGSGTQSTEMKRNFAPAEDTGDRLSPDKSTATTENGEDDDDIIDEPIDESLFAGDDLDELEDQMEAVKLKL